jgi:hypothetical protein
LFIDGTYKNGAANSILPLPAGSLKFGTISSVETFNGLIDELVICSKILSMTQISDLANSDEAKFCDWVEGAYESALEFDGIDDFVEFTNVGDLGITQNLTVEAWVQSYNWHGAHFPRIIQKTDVFDLFLDCGVDTTPPCDIVWRVNFESGSYSDIIADVDIPADTWVHIAATYNGTYMAVYLNGDNVENLTLTSDEVKVTSTNTITIADNVLNDKQFRGIIDYVRY